MVKLSFVGDIMCEEEQLKANFNNNNYDFSTVFEAIKPVFFNSDFVVGNLETPLAGQELEYTNHKWSFNAPVEFAVAVKNAGFDLVATSNNHSLDRGVAGLYKTIQNLNGIGLEQTGTYLTKSESDSICIKNIGGIKIAFLSYTYGTNSTFNNFFLKKEERFAINLFGKQQKSVKPTAYFTRIIDKLQTLIYRTQTTNNYLRNLKKKIKKAKQQADIVIVLMHSGGQYNIIPDRGTVKLLSYLTKIGVDYTIGCHPHVVQKIETNHNKQLGAYSLGNFCSYPGSDSCKMNQSEYSIILHIYIDKITKKLQKSSFQITKSVIDSAGSANIHLLFDLIQNEKNTEIKQQLIKDNELIYNRFLNKKDIQIEVKNDYEFISYKS